MRMTSDRNLIVIVGPTGSGKTDVAIEVAKRFGAPVVSADSRQFYKGMAIGTAQPTEDQLKEVKHYFIANLDIDRDYASGAYERDALELLERLFADNNYVVLVGGSGLYVDALCSGMDQMPEVNPELRVAINLRYEQYGLEALLKELRAVDPDFYEKVDRANPKRVIRALEVYRQTGLPYSSFRQGVKQDRGFNIVKIGTDVPREQLYQRINRRVDNMIEDGLEDEAQMLYPHRHLNSLQTVGYREFFDYFDGKITREEAIELIKRNSRRYAKRQMTWFGRDEDIRWMAPSETAAIIGYIEERTNTKPGKL